MSTTSDNVHQLPQTAPQILTKKQLMTVLGRSQRWIESRCAEGMPSAGFDRSGRRLFDLTDVNRWLDQRAAGLVESRSLTDRLVALEGEVAGLREVVRQLQADRPTTSDRRSAA